MAVVTVPGQQDGVLRAWVLPDGQVLCSDQAFLNMLGYSPQALAGQHIQDICVDGAVMSKALKDLEEVGIERASDSEDSDTMRSGSGRRRNGRQVVMQRNQSVRKQ